MEVKNFNENRTYGIEIEFKGDRTAVAAELMSRGIESNIESYNHHTRSYWKLITDASAEFELVSPILMGRDGLEQLKKVCEALNAAGARVDKTCGLHVHHGVNDYGVNDFKALYATYAKFEKVLDSFLAPSRRGSVNQYCSTLSSRGIDIMLEELKKVKTVVGMQSMFSDRYVKLNICSYIKYGTIEFRQHQGTLNFDKIYNWILLTQHMVETAKRRTVNYKYSERFNTIESFVAVMGLTRAAGADEELVNMSKWFKKRAAEFAQEQQRAKAVKQA
jgi:hypothetical protein